MAVEAVTINEGTQTPIAVDNVNGTMYQVIKVDVGADGAASPWTGAITNLNAGTVTRLEGGSIVVTAGTIGSLPNIPGGTLNLLTTLSNLTNGSIVVTNGTIASIPNTPGGTLNLVTTVSNLTNGSVVVTNGTIGAGTVQINPKPSRAIITYGTALGGAGATGITLLSAPGAGTSIYINEISLINRGTAAIQAYVGFGTASTAGTSQVVAGNLAGNGGIQKSYPKAVGGHITNLALLGSITAAGTVDVNLSYWVE